MWGGYPTAVRWKIPSSRRGLGIIAAILFVAAVGLSWSEGSRHLNLQALAMLLGLAAFVVAAMAARSSPA